jgi:hypothetical protein
MMSSKHLGHRPFGIFLLLVAGLMFGQAFAADMPSAATADAQSFAKVFRLRGDVLAGPAAGPERTLREGDRVMVGEKIRAAGNAEAVLRTEDAGMVAVRPGTEFIAQRFAAKGDSSDNMALRLITGSLRVITGWIGRTNRGGHQIITSSATIGIRGTDHEPYVLTADRPSADPANPHKAGTYDKVNRGGTSFTASGQTIDVDPGKVGFVRGEAKAHRSRALMTLLLPVILDKVPDFYVPGEFDAELDKFSVTADDVAQKELERQKSGTATPQADATPVARPTVPATAAPASTPASSAVTPAANMGGPALPPPAVGSAKQCVPANVAKVWLDQLDQSIHRRDGATIIGMFAQEATARAVVRKKDGSMMEIDFSRDELVKSTLSTVAQLEGYQHRRINVEATKEDKSCAKLNVKSVVIEQGKLSGMPYRFESVERYVLEPRDGRWLATKAETTQR